MGEADGEADGEAGGTALGGGLVGPGFVEAADTGPDEAAVAVGAADSAG